MAGATPLSPKACLRPRNRTGSEAYMFATKRVWVPITKPARHISGGLLDFACRSLSISVLYGSPWSRCVRLTRCKECSCPEGMPSRILRISFVLRLITASIAIGGVYIGVACISLPKSCTSLMPQSKTQPHRMRCQHCVACLPSQEMPTRFLDSTFLLHDCTFHLLLCPLQ